MNEENQQLNNPLHGVKLDTLVTELVKHYGFEILAEYTNINCFKNRPTIASSIKFLKKTEWAREKMERFYLYNFKNLPKADDDQYEITPRQRIIPAHQKPREPKVLIAGEAPAPKEKAPFSRSGDNRPARSNNFKAQAQDQNKSHNKSQNQDSSRNKERSNRTPTNERLSKKSTETSAPKSNDPWANSPK